MLNLKNFHQHTGLHQTEYASMSVISMTSAKTNADKKQIRKGQKIANGIC
jgi:hypothetical protein